MIHPSLIHYAQAIALSALFVLLAAFLLLGVSAVEDAAAVGLLFLVLGVWLAVATLVRLIKEERHV